MKRKPQDLPPLPPILGQISATTCSVLVAYCKREKNWCLRMEGYEDATLHSDGRITYDYCWPKND